MRVQGLNNFLTGTLRRQLVVGMVLVVGVMMTLLVWDQTRRQQSALMQQQSKNAAALAHSVAVSAAVWVASRDFSGLQEIVEGLAGYPDLQQAIVLDPRGEVLAHSDRTHRGSYLADLPSSPLPKILRRSETLIDVASPITLAGKHLGWVRIVLGQQSIGSRLDEIGRDGFLYVLFAVMLAAVLATLAARHLTRRLDAIQKVANAVQAGHQELRADIGGEDEAARLARQFNSMLDALARRREALNQKNAEAVELLNKIETLNQELEQRVDERTSDLNASKLALQQALAEERRARDDLKSSDERLQLAIDASGIGIWDWDLVSGIMTLDKQIEFMIGIPTGSFSGRAKDFFAYVLADDRDGLQAQIDKALNNIGVGFDAEYRIVKPDQSIRYVNARGEVTRDQGKVVGMTGTFEDISVRKQIELELEAARDAAESANLAKSQFLANMSHELRTPLNAIIGYSEILAEDAAETGDQQSLTDLEKIQGAGRHLLNLINDILDLSKVEAGKMELAVEVVKVREMIEDVVDTMRPSIEKNRNSLEVDCDDAVGEMHTDPQKLRQILYNLLSNAAKFTHDGRIDLVVTRSGQGDAATLEFTVHDTGIGISPAQIARLFQPFMQGDASTTRSFGGTGLGLVISRRLAQLLGGDIHVQSDPGEGSVFTLIVSAQVSDIAGQSGSVVEPKSAGITESTEERPGRLVLVIDDEADARELLRIHMQKDGWQVVTAADGETGLQLARELRPCAITLDVMMPMMDGWSVLQCLKADPELALIPVIMCSIVDEKARGFALGATDYLLKPVPRELLLKRLQKYRGARACHVLVVDDEASARELLQRNLGGSDWVVAQAADGRECLQRLAEQLPDIILLDLMMPGMDGFAVIDALQQNSLWQAIPVIVITAKILTVKERRWLNARVEHVMEKGQYKQDELLAEVSLRLDRVVTHDGV